jgi:AraC family transcriptional regulator, transcriptional activator of the genes for pyochelin and ferripyochelin receptors
MTLKLSQTDYRDFWRARNPNPVTIETPGYREFQEFIPESLGQGYLQTIELRGMRILMFNYQLAQDLLIYSDDTPPESSENWEFGFHLSGSRAGKDGGTNFVEWGSLEDEDEEGDETCLIQAEHPLIKVDIHLDQSSDLWQMLAEPPESLPTPARHCLESTTHPGYSEQNLITPAMRLVLEKLFTCPYQGRVRQVFLESQCLELIALKLTQLQQVAQMATTVAGLKPDDIERLYLARSIMAANYLQPPSLRELARQVGLNDFKLKYGFRKVFNTTLFGYLHHHRMTLAQEWLAEGKLNVQQVARQVGYANQSHFAAAFRRQFGMSPKGYQLQQYTQRCLK